MSWPMYRRVERQARQLQDVMDRLDVDPVALARLDGGRAFMTARSLCLHCGTSDICLRWLEHPPSPGEKAEFCPNLRLFDLCKRRC
jgi:hypothetical protein